MAMGIGGIVFKIEVSQYNDGVGYWVIKGYFLTVDSDVCEGKTEEIVTTSIEAARDFRIYRSAVRKVELLRIKFRNNGLSFKIINEEDENENNERGRISDFNYGRRIDTRPVRA